MPTVGDEVVLRARVSEFFNLTQLSSASLVTVLATGLDVDSAVEVTDAVPPADLADADRFWERHEGARMRVRAGSGATSGRDVFPSTADSEIWLVDVDDPLLDRADPYARRVFRDPHPLDNNPTPLFDDGNGQRIMLGSLGVKAAARRQHRAAAAGPDVRHADRRRGRRALLLVREVRRAGRVGRVHRRRRPVGERRRRPPPTGPRSSRSRRSTWRTCTTSATTRSTAATSPATPAARA